MDAPHTSGIYKIENIMNGKCYIGQTQDLDRRIKAHVRSLRNNTHFNHHLQNAWNKYGESAFEISIVAECGKDELDTIEEMFIEKYSAYEHGYNMGTGGGSNRGWKHSIDSRVKMSANHYDCSGKNNPMYGVTLYDVLSDSEIAHWKNSLSSAMKGENNPFFGRAHSAKTKSAISEANKGRFSGDKHPQFGLAMTSEARNRLRAAHNNWLAGKTHSDMPNARSIVCLNTLEQFGSIIEAAERYGIARSSISACCSGTVCSAGIVNDKHAVFMYIDDYNHSTANEIASKIAFAQAPNTGANNKRSKAVICLNTGIVYETCRNAASRLGLDYSTISKVCRGVNKSCGKDNNGTPLKWMFYNDYLSHANHESEA